MLVGGNCLIGRKMLLKNVYSKTAFVIVYMIVNFYFNYHIIQYHSKGDVMLRGPTILDTRCKYTCICLYS